MPALAAHALLVQCADNRRRAVVERHVRAVREHNVRATMPEHVHGRTGELHEEPHPAALGHELIGRAQALVCVVSPAIFT
jgi:hypothetical protein